MAAEVFVLFENQEFIFEIEDLETDIIAQVLDLDFKPMFLIHEQTHKVIQLNKKEKFTPGQRYRVKSKNSSSSIKSELWNIKDIKHIMQNAVIACKSTYYSSNEECKNYLSNNFTKHNLENIFKSQDDSCPFLVAEERKNAHLFISFRGSQSTIDWKDCMRVFQFTCFSSSIFTGKFHAGFLDSAIKFPLQRILNDERYKDRDLIFCGHSMGGAVATIVAIMAILEERKMKNALGGDNKIRWVKCFTFGAPLVGDSEMKEFCDKNDVSKHLYHSVEFMNPIPRLRSYKMCTEAVTTQLNQQDITKTIRNTQSAFLEIGNFLFLGEINQASIQAEFNNHAVIRKQMEIFHKSCLNDKLVMTANDLDRYEKILSAWGEKLELYPEYEIKTVTANNREDHITELRSINLITPYLPKIHDAQLIKLSSDILRLRLTGQNLASIIIEKCEFNIGFPFGNKVGEVEVKVTADKNTDVIFIDQSVNFNDVSIPEFGTEITVATLFGCCKYLLKNDKIRNFMVPSFNQLTESDDVFRLIKMAIQRGMGMAEIKQLSQGDSHQGSTEPIIGKVMKLAKICLTQNEAESLQAIFSNETKKANFILSNEEDYEKIKNLCDKVINFLQSPLTINVSTLFTKAIGISIIAIAAGSLFAALAGPGLLRIGVIKAISFAKAGGAGIFGAFGAGVAGNHLWDESSPKNYYEILDYFIRVLIKHLNHGKKEKDLKKLQEISDLRDYGKTYSLEKALLMIYNKNEGLKNFNGTVLEKCEESPKKMILNRIESIKAIHGIREILAKQFYIGIVGTQDAGKTTLLKKIWGVDVKCNLFSHTTKPQTYQINKNVYVVDFPGDNSLDHHAKTFYICGAINNFIILVIPFTGDINKVVSEEIANVFRVMEGSNSTKVILCINQCGPKLKNLIEELEEIRREPLNASDDEQWMKKFKQGVTGMSEALSEKFAFKLNEHFKDKICIRPEDVLFTDWIVGDESSGDSATFGLRGVEEIKKRIRDYLIEYKIYEKDSEELNKCFIKEMKV